MTAIIHLKGELSSDPGERLLRRADMIRSALELAVANPDMRVQMIVGEAYVRYRQVVNWLIGEIEKEKPAVHAAFQKAAMSVPKSRYENVQAVQALLIVDALAASELTETDIPECLTIEAEPLPEIPGTD